MSSEPSIPWNASGRHQVVLEPACETDVRGSVVGVKAEERRGEFNEGAEAYERALPDREAGREEAET